LGLFFLMLSQRISIVERPARRLFN